MLITGDLDNQGFVPIREVPVSQTIDQAIRQRVEFLICVRLRDTPAPTTAGGGEGGYRNIGWPGESRVRRRCKVNMKSPEVSRQSRNVPLLAK